MNRHHSVSAWKLSLITASVVTMAPLVGVNGASAAAETSSGKGWEPPFSTWLSVGSGFEMPAVASPVSTGEVSLSARKGKKGGVKFEHGRPGHTSMDNEEVMLARKGRKGGVTFEHGRPGHA